MPEYMCFMAAFGANILAHILNHAQNGRVQRGEHIQSLSRIQQRDILRGRDHNGASQLSLLAQCQLNIPGAGRQVDDQDVQFPPLHLIEHLLQCAHQHRTAPDNRLIRIDHQTDRHHRNAMGLERNNNLTIGTGRAFAHAHHTRLARTIYICIKQPDPSALLGQGHCQIGRYRRFTNTALA